MYRTHQYLLFSLIPLIFFVGVSSACVTLPFWVGFSYLSIIWLLPKLMSVLLCIIPRDVLFARFEFYLLFFKFLLKGHLGTNFCEYKLFWTNFDGRLNWHLRSTSVLYLERFLLSAWFRLFIRLFIWFFICFSLKMFTNLFHARFKTAGFQ